MIKLNLEIDSYSRIKIIRYLIKIDILSKFFAL
jgi:hypothetical protein